MIVCQDCGNSEPHQPNDGRCSRCGSISLRSDVSPNETASDNTTNLNAAASVSEIDATIDAGASDMTLDLGTVLPTDSPEVTSSEKTVVTFKTVSADAGDKTVVADQTVELGESNDAERTVDLDKTVVADQTVDQTIDGGSIAAAGSGSGSVFRGNASIQNQPTVQEDGTWQDSTFVADQSKTAENTAESMASRVSRGRGSLQRELNQESLNKWTMAAGESINPLLSLSAQHSFEYDEVPLTNRRRLAVDPKDVAADYEIVRAVGKGALGEVFAAKQKSLNRTVALKTISAARSRNIKDQRKFLYEARITSELTHPNIVPVHDLAVGDDGAPFYSMKLVSGTPWQKVIREKNLDENLDIFMKVCDAIGFAHSQNVIHRDLKPENIMLGDFGEVLVMDWGLAVDLSQEKKFDLAGTPAYMSPEMARHDIDLIGTTSDIYLLGAILYQIVTGKAPHPGKSVTECVIAASSNQLIPAPDPDHPLLKIAMVAIASYPEDRYETVAEFQDAIRDYRRHAESVSQTQRAEGTLTRAIEQHDYESFSRAVFGFSSALELWPENLRAKDGLDRARLAYGRAALERNDFDLALQVLRPDVEAERPLIEAAEAGKLRAQQREARIRRLTSTLAIGGGTAALIFLGLSLWALYQKGKATELARQQTELRGIAQASEAAAKESEGRALESDAKAREALEGERRARSDLASKNDELNEKNVQLDQSAKALASSLETQRELTSAAKQAANAAELAAKAEKEAREEADAARLAAVKEQKRAEQARLIAELRNYPANLSLAAIQIQQRDVGRTVDILSEIEAVEQVFAGSERGPKTDNWALGRIRLATNQDIPKYAYGGREGKITSADIDGRRKLVALGGADGGVELVVWNGGDFELVARLEADQCGGQVAVDAIALAEAGRWLAFSKKQRGGDTVYFWEPGSGEVMRQILPGLEVNVLRFDSGSKTLVAVLRGGGVRVWEETTVTAPTNNARTPKRLGQYALLNVEVVQNTTGENRANAVGLIAAGESQYLGFVDWQDDGGLRVLRADQAKGQKYVDFEMVDDSRLILGELEGRLQVAKLTEDGLQILEELRDDIHRTRITSLAVSDDTNKFLSVSLEPVIQVWERDLLSARGSYVPSLQLIGHRADSILQVAFADGADAAISVDEGGSVFFWDLKRQAERQVIARSEPASIIYAGGLGTNGWMRSVDANGLVSTWRGVDGKTVDLKPVDDVAITSRDLYQYVGHSPEASLQDLDVTADGRFAVSSALVEAGRNSYSGLGQSDRMREFCLWDFEKRSMLRRWTDRRSGFPCVAISSDGAHVAIGSNGEPHETVLVDVASGVELILVDDKGRGVRADDVAFREANGQRLTTVAYGGMVAEFDAKSGYKIVQYNRDFMDPPTSSSQIVAAGWNNDYFTVFFNSGHVRIFESDADGKLRSVANLGVADLRLQRGNVDWIFLEAERAARGVEGDFVVVARDVNRTQVVKVEGSSEGKWKVGERSTVDGNRWVKGISNSYELLKASELAAGVGLKTIQQCVFLKDGRYCATSSAGTVALNKFDLRSDGEDSGRFVLGRSGCVTAGGDAAAERLVLGCREGQIWIASSEREVAADETGSSELEWRAIVHPLAAIERIEVSPQGQYLAVMGLNREGERGVWCSDTSGEHGMSVWIEKAVGCLWKPSALHGQSELAVVFADEASIRCRTYRWLAGGNASIVGEGVLPIEGGKRVTGVAYFGERFADKSQATKWYHALQVRTELNEGSEILLVAEGDWREADSPVSATLRLPSQSLTAVCGSASDGLLATGDTEGAVSVWFMAPSIDQQAFELLSIDRHRGQPISLLAFSGDGSQLITADAGGRQFIWLAADPLGGVTPED